MRGVRVGGQALPDGVVMRTARAWAVARADGTVETGELPPSRTVRTPVLRVLSGVVLGLRVGFGRSGRTRRRSPLTGRLLVSLLATELAVVALDWVAGRMGLPRWGAPLAAGVICLAALAVFRAAAPGPQWAYHGAEHKAVSAYEADCDLDDVDAVLRCSRIHPRCGTNLVLWIAMAAPLAQRLPGVAQVVAYPLLLGVIAELLSLAARRPQWLVSRVLVAPGMLLQEFVTTTEPSREQQRIGCVALSACLERHHAIVSDPAHQPNDEQDDEDEYHGSEADIHGRPVPVVPAV